MLAAGGATLSASDAVKPSSNGPAAAGRGGTDLGIAEDGTALNSNPAGITQIPGYRLDAPFAIFIPEGEFSNARNPKVKMKPKTFFIPNFGFVFDLNDTGLVPGEPYRVPQRTVLLDHNKKLMILVPTTTERLPNYMEIRVRGRHVTLSNITVTADILLPDGPGSTAWRAEVVEVAKDPTPRDVDSFGYKTYASFYGFGSLPPEARVQRVTVYYDIETHFVNVGPVAGMTGDEASVLVLIDGIERGRYTCGLAKGEGQMIDALTEVEVAPMVPGSFRDIDQTETKFWKYGIGWFIQGGAGADWDIKTEIFPGGVRYYSDFVLGSLTPTIAYQFSPDFSAAFALNLNYSRVEFDTPLSQPSSIMKGSVLPPPLPPLLTFGTGLQALYGIDQITGKVQLKGSSLGLGARFGVKWKLSDEWSFGSSYNFKTMMYDYGGKARIDFTDQLDYLENVLNPSDSLLGIPFNTTWDIIKVLSLPNQGSRGFAADYDAKIVDFQFPMEFGAGVAYEPDQRWRFSGDFKYIQWADAFDTFKVKLTGGNNPDVNAIIGSEDIEVNLPLDWYDQYVVALGVEYRMTDELTLSAGYHYASQAIPKDGLLPIVPGIPTQHASLGARYKVGGWTFETAYEHAFENTLKSGFSESSHDLDNSTLKISQDTLWFQVSYEF